MSCDEFMCMEEDYGLEYSKERNSDLDAHLEYQYYKSKALKYNDLEAALLSFQKVLDLEEGEKGEWGFKALKQMIKINLKLMSNDEVLSRFKQLLTYIKSAITRYYSEKSIESILDYISTNKNKALLKNIYETTLGALEDTKNDRLWFKTNIQLGKLYLDLCDFDKLATILKLLFNSCIAVDDIQVQATELLEISALGIQRCAARRDSDKLKYLYELSISVESAFPCPLIMGYIRQCGGEMHFLEENFEMAHTDFFEAFKYYNKSGSPLRINCLIYILLTNMFEISEINIFDSQEAKPYTKHPKILAMTNLVMSIQNHNINERENIWKKIKNLMDDPFIAFILLKYISNIL